MSNAASRGCHQPNRFLCHDCKQPGDFVLLSCDIREEELADGGGFRLHFLPNDARIVCESCAMDVAEEQGLYVAVLPDGTRLNVCRRMEGLRNLPPQMTVIAKPAGARLSACWCERTRQELIFVELDSELRVRIERTADLLSSPSGELCMRRVAKFLAGHPDLHSKL